MKKKDIVGLIVLFVTIFVAGYGYFHRIHSYQKDMFLLDTIITAQIETRNKNGDEVLEQLADFIKDADSLYSCYKKNGTVWKINNSLKDSIPISQDIYKMLKIGKKLYGQTDSLYDLTIGRLTDIWDFEKKTVPTKAQIDSAMANAGYDKIELGENYIKRKSGIKLNFGSIAKGLIIDKSIEFLKERKIAKGLINAGGDIRMFGYKKPVKIGVQHPRKADGEIIGTITVKNKAVVTSGDYERYFFKNGKRYHHIINPKTGYPANNCISVTVIADSAEIADAYSTALFLLSPKKAVKLANNTKNLDAIIFYEKNGKIFFKKSFGMDKYLLNITDNNVKEDK